MSKLTLQMSCDPMFVYQGEYVNNKYRYIDNDIALTWKNTGNDEFVFEKGGILVEAYYRSQASSIRNSLNLELLCKEELQSVKCSSDQTELNVEQYQKDNTISWSLEPIASTFTIPAGGTITLYLNNLHCPVDRKHWEIPALLRIHVKEISKDTVTEDIMIAKRLLPQLMIYSFHAENRNEENDCYQVNYGENITLSWETNADDCILYPFDLQAEKIGSYTFSVYEDMIVTLRAHKKQSSKSYSVCKEIKIRLVDEKPVIKTFQITPRKGNTEITYEATFDHTTYGYIDHSIGRLEEGKPFTRPLDFNKDEFILTAKSKTQEVMKKQIAGNDFPEIRILDYTAQKTVSGFHYRIYWNIVNLKSGDSITLDTKGKSDVATVRGTAAYGDVEFDSSELLRLHIYTETKDIDFDDIYPNCLWED